MNLVAVQCQLHVACRPYDVTSSNAEEVADIYVPCVTSTTGPQPDVSLSRLERLFLGFLLFSEISSSLWYILTMLAFTNGCLVLALGKRCQRSV